MFKATFPISPSVARGLRVGPVTEQALPFISALVTARRFYTTQENVQLKRSYDLPSTLNKFVLFFLEEKINKIDERIVYGYEGEALPLGFSIAEKQKYDYSPANCSRSEIPTEK